jgi:hypothetical protein
MADAKQAQAQPKSGSKTGISILRSTDAAG